MKTSFVSHALALALLLSASCTERRPEANDVHRTLDINELVSLRTEGLALAEIAASTSSDAQVRQAIGQIRAYYQDTHPAFLEICRGQLIVLEQRDFDMIWMNAQGQVLAPGQCAEEIFLSLYVANTAKKIAVYERVLREPQAQGLYLFALQALPGLYSQQEEILGILRNKTYTGDTVTATLAK